MGIVVVGTVAFDSVETPFGSVQEALGARPPILQHQRAFSQM